MLSTTANSVHTVKPCSRGWLQLARVPRGQPFVLRTTACSRRAHMYSIGVLARLCGVLMWLVVAAIWLHALCHDAVCTGAAHLNIPLQSQVCNWSDIGVYFGVRAWML